MCVDCCVRRAHRARSLGGLEFGNEAGEQLI